MKGYGIVFMNQKCIVLAIKDSILESQKLTMSIFGTLEVPENVEEFVLAISSIDFVDLMIKVEDKLGIDASEYMSMTKLKIGDLAKRIAENE